MPKPLEIVDPVVKYEFIRMPDSTGFGDYTESGQVIPVRFDGEMGGYVHAMFLDDDPPIAGGRELWGFPKKLAYADACASNATRCSARSTTARSGSPPAAWATSTRRWTREAVLHALAEPGFLLKIIPHVDGTPRICELVRYRLGDIDLKGAWSGPAALELHPHALAPLTDLPVLEVISGIHLIADLTLNLGEVVHDYLAK